MFDLELSMAGACSNAATLSEKRRSVLRTAGVYDIGLRACLAPRLRTRVHNFRIATRLQPCQPHCAQPLWYGL
jgi:hypothetical protein